MTSFICGPGGQVSGEIRVPGDKSISHRSIILSSIAEGTSNVSGFLEGEDSLNTLTAFRAMGVDIYRDGSNLSINGVGLNGLSRPDQPLDMGNSGTAMRLLLGLLSGQAFNSVLVGDKSLSGRPMNRVIKPLLEMGAIISSREGGTAPLAINSVEQINPIDYLMPVASAQVKSCILLAGLYASGKSSVKEPAPTRDHTERMLRAFGCTVSSEKGHIQIDGKQTLKACDIDVPADISSAAFFIVAATLAQESEIKLNHVGINPTRTGIIEILRLMGANIGIDNQRDVGGEPVADLIIRSASLKGIQIPESLVPLAIDEFPVIFIAAACAHGETVLTGAEELRVKESDRIQVMADGLSILGIEALPTPDGMRIQGGEMSGGRIDSHGDHRIAMAFSIASLRSQSAIEIENCRNVDTSFPGFAALAKSVGIGVQVHE
ncbi:MAG: 3-phosphoshikimate 1-carboxyvinyltransferase [Gammaproteobacteria bacterium]|jgi:3-phosphoshikimate 1-carboxyvinyltransferase